MHQIHNMYIFVYICICVHVRMMLLVLCCVFVSARARACVRACLRACVCVRVNSGPFIKKIPCKGREYRCMQLMKYNKKNYSLFTAPGNYFGGFIFLISLHGNFFINGPLSTTRIQENE